MKKWHNKNQPGCFDQNETPMEEDSKGAEGTPRESPEDEYLRNVGEEVQAMLDPFGKKKIKFSIGQKIVCMNPSQVSYLYAQNTFTRPY